MSQYFIPEDPKPGNPAEPASGEVATPIRDPIVVKVMADLSADKRSLQRSMSRETLQWGNPGQAEPSEEHFKYNSEDGTAFRIADKLPASGLIETKLGWAVFIWEDGDRWMIEPWTKFKDVQTLQKKSSCSAGAATAKDGGEPIENTGIKAPRRLKGKQPDTTTPETKGNQEGAKGKPETKGKKDGAKGRGKMSKEKKDVEPKKAAGETKGTGKRAASSEKLTEKIGKHRKECLQDGIWKAARDTTC